MRNRPKREKKKLKASAKQSDFGKKKVATKEPEIFRTRKSKYEKSFLIICEGETEKSYFEGIKHSDRFCNQLRSSEIRNIERPDDNSPRGLFLEAMKLKTEAEIDGLPYSSDGIWVVFDNDNRDKILDYIFLGNTSEFFKSKVNELYFDNNWQDTIRIAYSGIGFETWILLHFEKNSTAFPFTECKYYTCNRKGFVHQECKRPICNKSKRKEVKCGNPIKQNEIQKRYDCKGKLCIGGYLRSPNSEGIILHKNYQKGDKESITTIFDELADEECKSRQDIENSVFSKIEFAIENAKWLRTNLKHEDRVKVYKIIPYTDVDFLVTQLIDY